MKLVKNWRTAWRWFSMQLMSLVVLLPLAWEQLPIEVKVFIPEGWLPYILAGVALCAMVGRMIDQSGDKRA